MNQQERILPVSKGHWIFGNLPNMARDIRAHFFDTQKRLGLTFENPVPTMRIIATADPEFIRHVLTTNARNYKKGRSYEVLRLFLGKGLVTSNGDFWQKQRRLIQPAFHRKNLEDLFEVMALQAREYFDELEKKRGTVINIEREMMVVTARIALKSLFSDSTSENMDLVYDRMTSVQRYIADMLQTPFGHILFKFNGRNRKFKNERGVIDDIINDSIARRRQDSKRHPDLLQMLMDSTYEDTNEQMDDQQLKDEMITMFSAGHETSANGLSWTLYLLAQHPEIVNKMRDEIKEELGDRLPGFEELRKLTYVKQVIDEGMRIYPPVWAVSRAALEEDTFDGVKIKKGDTVFCTIYSTHHSEEFFPSPEKFDPDRFAPDRIKEMTKMSYLPFGGGPRMCIGSMFAIMEMQLILVGLLQRFNFVLVDDQKIEMEALVTLRPRYGIKMKLS